ncbi:MAG: sulfite exporter TauE/SafE family protein [Candidatus Cryptobacteroides sp.]
MNALYILLLSICASFIQRTIGFGFGIFIMTMLPFLMPSYGEATALSGLLALTTSLITAIRMRKVVSWKRLLPILITFAVFSAVAVSCLARMQDTLLRCILGIVLILTSLYFMFFSRRIHLRPTLGVQIGAGALSGLMGGFFGMQGPPAVLYFISSEPDKEHYIAITQWYFVLGNLFMTFARAGNGFVTGAVGKGYIFGLGGVAIGTTIGAIVFRHIPAKILNYLVYAYIGISGIIVLATL